MVYRRVLKTRVDIIINQWELKAKTGNLLKARKNASDQDVIGFSFAFHRLRSWLQFPGPNENCSEIRKTLLLHNKCFCTFSRLPQ